MNINDLTFGQLKEINALFSPSANLSKENVHPCIGKYVIVRTWSAGVHVGILTNTTETIDGLRSELTETRRIWKWSGANTLSEISLRGVDTSDSKLSEQIDFNCLEKSIEIIPCTVDAEKNLRGAKWK